MSKSAMSTKQKVIIGIFSVLIVGLALFALVPVLYAAIMGPGVKTEPMDASNAEPATVDVDGTWEVAPGVPPNSTSVGFTFDELLPNEYRSTSGSTHDVSGQVVVEEGQLTSGEVTVDMTNIVTDQDVRDESVRNKLFESADYPTSNFTVTEPVDVSQLPEDGTPGTVELTGDLTIKDNTHEVTETFDVLRDEGRLVLSGDIVIDRNDYGVESPQMIAAEIADEGEINLRISLQKVGE